MCWGGEGGGGWRKGKKWREKKSLHLSDLDRLEKETRADLCHVRARQPPPLPECCLPNNRPRALCRQTMETTAARTTADAEDKWQSVGQHAVRGCLDFVLPDSGIE